MEIEIVTFVVKGSAERFKGELFKNGRRYAKSANMIQTGLKKRIKNCILEVQFEHKKAIANQIYYTHNMKYIIGLLQSLDLSSRTDCVLHNLI